MLAVAGLLALAGCGSNDVEQTNRYVDAVNAAQGRLSGTLDRLTGRITSASSPAADRATLHAFDAALARAIAQLRSVQPPADVAPLHRRLVGTLGGYGADVRRQTAALRSDDPRRLVGAQQRLLDETDQVSRRMNATIASINRRLTDK